MNTPIASAESLQIGSVDFVSPDEIKVLLDLDAPSDVALNSGVPRPFPRINSYVLIAEKVDILYAKLNGLRLNALNSLKGVVCRILVFWICHILCER